MQELSGSNQHSKTVTNFAVLKTPKAKEIYNELLKRSICVPLFSRDFLRITAGTKEENKVLLAALSEILEKGRYNRMRQATIERKDKRNGN